jgi:hypothetical protein
MRLEVLVTRHVTFPVHLMRLEVLVTILT